MTDQRKRSRSRSAQYLTFALGDETYAVDILSVREILAGVSVTPIPTAPPFVKGVINIRGTVSPVIGLREKFQLPPLVRDPKFAVVVVVLVGGQAIGIEVDAATDVMVPPEEGLERLPEVGGGVNTSFISGVLRQQDRFAVVLDTSVVLREAVLPHVDLRELATADAVDASQTSA